MTAAPAEKTNSLKWLQTDLILLWNELLIGNAVKNCNTNRTRKKFYDFCGINLWSVCKMLFEFKFAKWSIVI